ncbi:MAG: aromatic amino acid lyase, partial [Fimbriimonadaceae bacterium]
MVLVDGRRLTLAEIGAVAEGGSAVSASSDARIRMARSRAAIDEILKSGEAVYGVNTGFGKLSDVRIPDADLAELQHNLLRSHACGVGPPLSRAETRAMLLLRANVLARGHSGARPEVLDTLVAMLQRGVVPVVPEKGSVGASGDLAPLAHLALVAIGEGEAWGPGGERIPGRRAMAEAGIPLLDLKPKEGLALLNGTQAMVAVGALALRRAWTALRSANRIGAMTLEALKGTPAAFDPRIHDARGHAGQSWVAADLRTILEQSEIRESHRSGDPRVQDAYSLRCMPQVHGAVWQALREATRIVEAESGASTDNPLVFADPDSGEAEVLSGGNFHGAPVALALDYAAIAL